MGSSSIFFISKLSPPRKDTAKPAIAAEDVLVEDNRYTPYGALSGKYPEHSVQGAPVKPKEGRA